MNSSNSFLNQSSHLTPITIDIVCNSAAILLCLLATILVFCLKLYKKVVYRLTLCQVISALLLSVFRIFQLAQFMYYRLHPIDYDPLCVLVGWFVVHLQWMKLLFTLWVAFHLFCFAVLYKNLRKLEAMYVVTSVLVPAVIAAIPFATDSYATTGWCYLNGYGIEEIAIWDAPALALLLAASIAMIVMVAKLARTVRSRARCEELTDGDQYWKALKQLLPLAAFPVLFFVLAVPVLVFDIYVYFNPAVQFDEPLDIFVGLFYSLWSLSSGITLLVHISVARFCSQKKKHSFRIPVRHYVAKTNDTA